MDRIGFDFEYGAMASARDDWQRDAHGYTITLTYQRRTHRLDYWQGPAICEDPTLESVMYCLASDAQFGEQGFDDFCADLGYDTDSRKAHATWEACRESARQLRRLFGADFDEIMSREWDA